MAWNSSNTTNSTNSTNSSTQNPTGDEAIDEPHQLATLRRIIFAFVIILAVFGNLIVIRAIRTTGSSRKPFTHYLVTCLAIAEILTAVFLTFTFVQEEIHYWPFGSFMCHVTMPGGVITFSVTTATLACISLYRYRVLVTPYKKTPSRRTCLMIICLIWVYSFSFAVPIILKTSYERFQWHQTSYHLCILDSQDLTTYSLVRTICQFFLPVLIMFVSYTASSFTIKEHLTFMEARRQIRINSNISTLNTYIESQGNGCDQNHLTVPLQQPPQPVILLQQMGPRGSEPFPRRPYEINETQVPIIIQRSASVGGDGEHMIESERDIIKMFYVVVLVFLVCYIPYQVMFLLDHFGVSTYESAEYYHIVRKFVFLLISFPSALHPLCYGTMSRFYAKAFSNIVLCKCMK